MAYENSMLSQDLEFYSAYDYEEREEGNRENFFIQLLWKVLLGLTLLITIFFIYNYFSKVNIDFKKFDFWNISIPTKPLISKVDNKENHIESKTETKKIDLKPVEIERIATKVMNDMHKEKVETISKRTTKPKVVEVSSTKQIKKPYLVDEYLDAIKRELEKN